MTCSPSPAVVLSPNTGYCECLIGYYAIPASGDCQGILELIYLVCHSSCGSCKGLTEYDCLDCKRSIMQYDPLTYSCNCPPKNYKASDGNCLRIYIYIYIKLACDECCKECTGPSNKECRIESCAKVNSCYPLYGSQTTCLYVCKSTTSLYLDTSTPTEEICRKCHNNCQICFETTNETCLQCISPYLLTNEKECLFTSCDSYPDTFHTEGKCAKCNDNCDGCKYSNNYCLNCTSPYFFHLPTHSCLLICPEGFYANKVIWECQSNYIYIYIYYSLP